MTPHVVTIAPTDENRYTWRCSCGTSSLRDNLTFTQANRGAESHETAMSYRVDPVMAALATATKWLLIACALAVPYLAADKFGTEVLTWIVGAEALVFGAFVLDRYEATKDERAHHDNAYPQA